MVTRHRQELTNLSLSSTCTSNISNFRWSDISSTSSFSPTSITFPRPIIKSARRCILPALPPAWLPTAPVSPQTPLRHYCLPLPEPRPPPDILNRSSLSSCSPSLVKFSRTSLKHTITTSPSTTIMPSTPNPGINLHPMTNYLTVNGIKTNYHHHHQRYRQTR